MNSLCCIAIRYIDELKCINGQKTHTERQTGIHIDTQVDIHIILSVRLLSVLLGHSVCSSSPQRPLTSDFERFYSPDFIHYIFLKKKAVLSFTTMNAKLWNFWYHFYNVFDMMRSLTGDWTRDLPHSKPTIEETVYIPINWQPFRDTDMHTDRRPDIWKQKTKQKNERIYKHIKWYFGKCNKVTSVVPMLYWMYLMF